ncbi:MAG TPA: metallophosphoesterase family protein [Dehalococcoidia bacterium]|nr:metallophosphoesterase family protein [Dehalococcoidia bacterium]
MSDANSSAHHGGAGGRLVNLSSYDSCWPRYHMRAMRIGLISDTHMPFAGRALWDEVDEAFFGVELILHAGDIVHPVVLDRLDQIAPVLAARGNNDYGIDDARILDQQVLDLHDRRLVMLHDMEPEDRPIDYLRRAYLRDHHADIIVTGHTHFERLTYRDGVLQINPGSATLPHLQSMRLGTVALLDWSEEGLEVRIQRLGHSEGLRNPGVEYAFTPSSGVVRLD